MFSIFVISMPIGSSCSDVFVYLCGHSGVFIWLFWLWLFLFVAMFGRGHF